MTIRTTRLEDGKYEIDRDADSGLMVACRRNGEPWNAGIEHMAFAKVIHAMLNRIEQLGLR